MFWCHITATYGYEQYGKNYRLTLNIGFSLQWKKHIFWLDKRKKNQFLTAQEKLNSHLN